MSSSPVPAAGGTMFGQTIQTVTDMPPNAMDAVLADISKAWMGGGGQIDDSAMPGSSTQTITVTAKKIPYALILLLAVAVYYFR